MSKKEDIYKITAIVLLFDQIIKLIINHALELNQIIKIIPGFFSIDSVINKRAAFSILVNNKVILVILSIIVIIILDRYIKKEKVFSKMDILSLGLILGGIFGNLIDRIIHHGVIDYLSFTFFNYSFPIFNLADMAITGGVLVLLLSMILKKKERR